KSRIITEGCGRPAVLSLQSCEIGSTTGKTDRRILRRDREGEDLMTRTVRTGLLSLIAWGLTAVSAGQAQTLPKAAEPPSQNAGTASAAGAAGPAVTGLNEVVATVTTQNRTDKVTKGEVLNYLSRNPLPAPEDRDAAYHVAADVLINTAMLNQ